MSDFPTKALSDGDGSTEPQAFEARIRREAAKIKALWKSKAGREAVEAAVDADCLRRHKSLVMNLALEDYEQVAQTAEQSVSLSQHCQQYSGFGKSIEHSIYRQLEVKKYLDENPALLNLENQFLWPEPGDTCLENFRVLEELGRGALARVYLCEQLNLGSRSAVVKIELGRSKTEHDLLGKLRHPHIVPVHGADYDSVANVSHLRMPFLGRSTLIDLLQLAFHNSSLPTSAAVITEAANLWIKDSDTHHLEPTTASTTWGNSYVDGMIRIALDLATALAYAHSQHVIHGDIKPSNVLLTPSGAPLLFDFNLGRDKGNQNGPTGGTLAYMSPEQLKFLTASAPGAYPSSETSTDIFAFGALCYELLSGRLPFPIPAELADQQPTNNEAVAAALIELQRKGCPSLRTLNPEVDGPLAKLIESCLAFEPAERPATMQGIRDRLAPHTRLVASGRRYAKTHPLRMWTIGLTTLTAIAAASLFYYYQPTLVERARSARQAGEWQQSVALLGRALIKDPQLESARLDRIRSHVKLGDYAAAHSDFALLKPTEIKDPAVIAYRGYFLNLTGKPNSAALWYERALEYGGNTTAIFNNLGTSVMLHNKMPLDDRLTKAKTMFERALQLNPESTTVHWNSFLLAQALLTNGSPHEGAPMAIRHAIWLQQARPNDPKINTPRFWERIFSLYNVLVDQKLESRNEAFAQLKRAIKSGASITHQQLETDQRYTPYHELPGYKQVVLQAAEATSKRPAVATYPPLSRFIDPLADQR